MNRRRFLTLAAAVAVAPTALASAPPAPAVSEAIAIVAAPLRKGRPAWLGYHAGDGYYHEGGKTIDDTIRILQGDGMGGERVEIALCDPIECRMPDYHEKIVEWLADDSTWPLADALHEEFWGANEDADYEGEVESESGGFDWTGLANSFEAIITAALERHGIFVEEIVAGCLMDAEYALDALEKDAVFKRDLKAATDEWETRHDIDIGNRIETSEPREVYVPKAPHKLAFYTVKTQEPGDQRWWWEREAPSFQTHPRF